MADSTPNTPSETDNSENTAYQVLARKYRPSTFDELLGQDAMVQTLTNAFKANRIAQAYMLTGVRGVGKTTTARLIARALNYVPKELAAKGDKTSKPTTDFSEIGEHCQAIMESRHVDVIEMDAASKTGIDDVREIIESVRYKPVSAPYKVYIIDEIHMLSKQAFNALLKTLEEPPEHVKFVFATTEIRKVPVTILSRCQRFDLRRFDAELLVSHLTSICGKENVEAEEEALKLIARAGEGSARDALSLLDQAIAYGGSSIKSADVQNMLGLVDRARVIDLFESVMKGDIASALNELKEQYDHGGDPQTMLSDFANFVHWVTRIKVVPASADNNAYTEQERVRGKEFADQLSLAVLAKSWQMALKGLNEVATSPNAMMAVEMVFIRMAYASELPSPTELVKKLQNNPSSLSSAVPQQSGSAASSRLTQDGPSGQTSPSGQGNGPSGSPAGGDNIVHMAPHMTGNVAVQSQQQMAPAGDVTEPQKPQFSSFQDIVDHAKKMRDIRMKTALEETVRPINVSDGKIEIALEPGASKGLAGELSRKMEQWTGKRWMVSIAPTGGDAPLRQQLDDARNTLFKQAREHPVVQSVFETFSTAEITDVRDFEAIIADIEINDEEHSDN